MGSPITEPERNDTTEQPHLRKIGRSFAIATKPVTVAQFQRFYKLRYGQEYPYPHQVAPSAECPIIKTDWYLGAEYCNWLSEQEGLEPCYVPNKEGKYARGMKLARDCLQRTGYRMPTEAEWEFACRAGTVTSRYYGESKKLLAKYGWYVENSQNHTWPVGSLKPNDLGLFDMYGNVWCRCQSKWNKGIYKVNGDAVLEDTDDAAEIQDDESWAWRGGSYINQPMFVRSAYHRGDLATDRSNNSGFRLARTIL
jgi:formylglycine-generating enzyme required for sulfatase activity